MAIVVREPRNEIEFDRYYELRWEVLRKPWHQPKGSEKDEHEPAATHIIACINNKIVGVGRVHFNSEKEAQIRYMAVEAKYRRKGIGRLILEELERTAREKGAVYVILNARENVTDFYRVNGYEIIEPAHTLFGSIKHWKMEKKLLFPGKTG